MRPNRTSNSMSNLTWGSPMEIGFNYPMRLHFCEIDTRIHVSSSSVFTIYTDYQLAKEMANVILWADDNNTPYYKDYVVMIQNKGEDSHTLAIDLHPKTYATFYDAILNGVEVFKLSDLSSNLARLNMIPPLIRDRPRWGPRGPVPRVLFFFFFSYNIFHFCSYAPFKTLGPFFLQ